MNGENILIIEDETIIALDVEEMLRAEGYGIAGVVPSGQQGLDLFAETKPDLVLLDIVLSGDMDGIETARRIRRRSDVPLIYMTAHGDPGTFLRARETSPSGYLYKPIDRRDLLSNIDSALARHRIELRLMESEELFRLAASTLSDIIYEWDLKEKTIKWHGDIESLLGFEKGSLADTQDSWVERIHPDDIKRVYDAVENGLKTGERHSVEMRYLRSDGSVIYCNNTGIVVRDRARGTVRIIGAITDITDRKAAEEAIRRKNEEIVKANRELQRTVADLEAMNDEYERANDELLRVQQELIGANERLKTSEEVFSRAFHGNPNVMVLNRLDTGEYVEVNDTALKVTGYAREEVIGKNPVELGIYVHPGDARKTYGLLSEKGTVRDFETSYRCKDGTVRKAIQNSDVIYVEGKPHVITSFFDITDRALAEVAILRAEKLESLGLLAGGIAHDFNNILMGILGNLSVARTSPTADDELRGILESAEKSCLRARDLTGQLLTFSRGGAPLRKSLSLEKMLADSVNFNLAGSAVKARFSIQEGLWPVHADEGQISQVINNMVINAVQAMPGGGVIEIEASNRMVGEEDSPVTGESMKPGRYAVISIGDHGRGIPPDINRRIFEPYFTTKPGGSGLGLAVVYSIIRNHDGYIDFTSVDGEGTVFRIYLPAAPGMPAAGEHRQHSEMAGRGRILVMDDEPVVLDVVKRMLEHLGYQVSLARDGGEAVALYREAMAGGAPFSGVIMDLVVPGGMGGREAIGRLREMDPGVKAVVSSGYSSDSVMADYERYGFRGFIQKPFRLEDLGELLKRVI